MIEVKNHFAPNPNIISQLVELGMKGEQGKRLVQSYYNNPPAWMTPSEARLYVPLAAERLGRIEQQVQKIAAPQTTVAEDRIAGLAGIQPQQAPMQQQAQPEQQVQEGGVADLPVPDSMFQEQSMAGGGIVAFDDGGEVPRFANRGLVALNVPQLQSNLQFLMQQYDAVPEGTPLKAQLAEQIEQIQSQLSPTAPKAASPYAGIPQLEAADREIGEAKTGIAGLMKDMEFKPEDLKKMGTEYMTEREGAGASFRTKAEELMGKQEKRVADLSKDTGLKTALNFFTNLAASKSPYFATAAGEAGKSALEYYDTAREKQDRAQAALESSQINYQMARAAESKGDFDARDRFLNAAKDDKRNAVSARIKGYEAQGTLAAKQAESYLNLKKTEIDKIRAEADLFRAKAPPDIVQTMQYIEGKYHTANKAGIFNDKNGGKPLSDAQISDLAYTATRDLMRRGDTGDTYKGATLDAKVGDATNNALLNNQEYINARSIATDANRPQKERDAAEKRMTDLRTKEYNKQRNLYKKDFDVGPSEQRQRSMFGSFGGGADASNPLGLNLPPL